MAAVRCNRNEPKTASVPAATLTLLVPGDDVRVIWVTSDSALWLFQSSTLRDGDATPGSDRIPIAANERKAVIVGAGKRVLVASQTGTVTGSFHGVFE